MTTICCTIDFDKKSNQEPSSNFKEGNKIQYAMPSILADQELQLQFEKEILI